MALIIQIPNCLGFQLSSLQFLRPFRHQFTIKIGERYRSSLYFHQNQHSKTILSCVSAFLTPISTKKIRDLTDAFIKEWPYGGDDPGDVEAERGELS
ncbi:hypothetical protein E1A91_A12G045700v1 [Gossypium mustelinum]|uniref:Uncharacterized protein n=1 Tax=Gossypium mustelinum TaxID=34275 RepID=A0A5D2WQE6_GOSMU|nr:hypothetical protein E1A91_A12G045700v1 [Gossypium mustelinum]